MSECTFKPKTLNRSFDSINKSKSKSKSANVFYDLYNYDKILKEKKNNKVINHIKKESEDYPFHPNIKKPTTGMNRSRSNSFSSFVAKEKKVKLFIVMLV